MLLQSLTSTVEFQFHNYIKKTETNHSTVTNSKPEVYVLKSLNKSTSIETEFREVFCIQSQSQGAITITACNHNHGMQS